MIYSDQKIYQALQEPMRYGGIRLNPFNPGQVNPNSYDVTLGDEILVYRTDKAASAQEAVRVSLLDQPYIMLPGEFVLATTRECISLGNQVCARVAGKSSRAREGLSIEYAGWVDSGWHGQITLELACHLPNALMVGKKIGQVVFLDSHPVLRPYGSDGVGHYQGQMGTTESWEA